MSTLDYRSETLRTLVVDAERSAIMQRTLVGRLRTQLAEEERQLGILERNTAEARGLAADLGVSLDGLDYGRGTLAEVFATPPE